MHRLLNSAYAYANEQEAVGFGLKNFWPMSLGAHSLRSAWVCIGTRSTACAEIHNGESVDTLHLQKRCMTAYPPVSLTFTRDIHKCQGAKISPTAQMC